MTEINELKGILKKHEERISNLEKLLRSKPVVPSLEGEKIILNLISSGFFDKPKGFGEIIEKLKTQAKFNKKDNYTKILKKLTSEDKLERKMVEHQWRYVKNE